jgi:hypothetical protein
MMGYVAYCIAGSVRQICAEYGELRDDCHGAIEIDFTISSQSKKIIRL